MCPLAWSHSPEPKQKHATAQGKVRFLTVPHSIKATLPFLMEGGNTLVIFHQSHRQYIPSHHTEGVPAQMDVVHVVVICSENAWPGSMISLT